MNYPAKLQVVTFNNTFGVLVLPINNFLGFFSFENRTIHSCIACNKLVEKYILITVKSPALKVVCIVDMFDFLKWLLDHGFHFNSWQMERIHEPST